MQKVMYIGGYKVLWRQVGWSYAKVFIYERRQTKFLWWNKFWDEEVWEHPNNKGLGRAQTMLPSEQVRWFNEAIKDYEKYKSDWAEYKEK